MNPYISAYSGISNPVKQYSESQENYNLTPGGTKSVTLTINVNEGGKIQAFQAILNFRALDPVANTYTTCAIYRNGTLLSIASIDHAAIYNIIGYRGVGFIETLNILSGADVFPGEVFKFVITKTDPGGAYTSNQYYDLSMFLIVIPQGRQFISI